MEIQGRTLEQELLDNPRAGPRPLTAEDYKRRNQRQVAEPKQAAEPEQKVREKTRGGRQAKRSNKIRILHQLVNSATTKQEKQHFKKELKKLQKERSREYKIKRARKKQQFQKFGSQRIK